MGFLERAIRRGVSDAVGKAVGNAVRQAVEPAATNLVNQATQSIDQANGNSQQQTQRSTVGLEGAMSNLESNEYEVGYYSFSADFAGNHLAASQAVESYRQLLLQNGFRQAGQYPSMNHLYKMVDGVCYHVDTEHCFEGDPDSPTIGFDKSEPYGGFNYVKPEPKKKTSFMDLFK